MAQGPPQPPRPSRGGQPQHARERPARERPARNVGRRRLGYVALLVPFVALLWVPWYASREPELFGFPFFYWYQFLWVILTSGIVAAVYLAGRERPRHRGGLRR
jgi:hypothetical protein